MTYNVIKRFADLTDNNHPYEVGDTFPRPGLTVSEERIAELSGPDNKQGAPLIRAVETAEATAEEAKEAADAEATKDKPKKKAASGKKAATG